MVGTLIATGDVQARERARLSGDGLRDASDARAQWWWPVARWRAYSQKWLCAIELAEGDVLPSTDAVSNWLRHTWTVERLTDLSRINQRIIATRIWQASITPHTQKVDASRTIAEKKALSFYLQGRTGCISMIWHFAEAAMVIHEEFRKGNEAPAASNLEFITPSITTFCKYSKETKNYFAINCWMKFPKPGGLISIISLSVFYSKIILFIIKWLMKFQQLIAT